LKDRKGAFKRHSLEGINDPAERQVPLKRKGKKSDKSLAGGSKNRRRTDRKFRTIDDGKKKMSRQRMVTKKGARTGRQGKGKSQIKNRLDLWQKDTLIPTRERKRIALTRFPLEQQKSYQGG